MSWTMIALVCTALSPAGSAGAWPTASVDAPADGGAALLEREWRWPLHPFRIERAFVAPAHAYGPGHRGVDLAPLGDASVRTPAAGVIAFSGQVAGRLLVTIDHGDGLVSTLEPVESSLVAGTPVARGDEVGRITAGGHAQPGSLHFGVRLHGEYINPLVLLGGVPRAVLLPCC
jgi:murein DD-endopeptidase MepM/ murein hydrolase activator NlpD